MLILLIDDNNFFIEGLSYILTSGFQQRGIAIHFTRDRQWQNQADIVISAEHPLLTCQHRPWRTMEEIRLFWFSREHSDAMSLKGSLTFSRAIDARALWLQIDQMLNHGRQHYAVAPRAITLTEREKEIMQALAAGARLRHIAQRHNLSVKTISAHKRRAMEKFNLRTTQELVQWLRACGLMAEPPGAPRRP